MSVITSTMPTLVDVASRTGADKKIVGVAEVLNQGNEILEDAVFLEGNDGTGHKTTVRSGLPSATWRQLNYGVQPSKSKTVPIKDTCGMLEAYAEVDKSLADLNGNAAEFRASEDVAFIESMNQNMASTIFYGNTAVNPERFLGLAARYNDRTTAENKKNILTGGGAGATNTSVWLIVWGPLTCHMIYPKGSKAGLSHEDLGVQTLDDGAGGKFQGYRSHYKWDAGLVLRDWRYVVRIANIDVTTLTKNAGSGADLVDLITQAIELVPNLKMGRAAIYCNGTIRSYLRRQIRNSNNVNLSLDQVAGKQVLSFDGIPVRKTDALLSTEAVVS
jgi:hypothetical protein